MKIVAVIPVRMGSSRLPGKAMLPLLGKPVLAHLVARVQRSKLVHQVVVALPVNPEDDVIADYCHSHALSCFRGAEDDVLGRLLGALQSHQADVGVVIYGDCPLIDPLILDEVVNFFLTHHEHYDFVSNDLQTTYPPGMEVEAYHVRALADAAHRTQDPHIREHGTLFIRQHPELYRLHNLAAPPALYHPLMEMELDTVEDLKVITAILTHFARQPDFSAVEIVHYLKEHPELMQLNQNIERRWKEFRHDLAD